MSKKTITKGIVIMIMFLFFRNNGIAEEFTFSFRNNISFGDSMESVQSKEVGSYQDHGDPNILNCQGVALSGINNSSIFYHFEYDKLDRIRLSYHTDDFDTSIQDYEVINGGLIRKYGNPIENEESATTYIGGAIEQAKSLGEGNDKISNKEIHNQNQWVIMINEESKIIIEHVLLTYSYQRYKKLDPELCVVHQVSYQYFEKNTLPTDLIDKDL